ncbi:MAG: DUF2207 domain-containing protein, partial [Gemmatimonadota bacterium]
ALASTLLALVAAASGAAAQGRSLEVESFESDVRVFSTAAVEVTEAITYRFDGSWNGVYRHVPVRGERTDGSEWRMKLELLSVEDADGEELRHETSMKDGRFRVKTWVPGARDTTRTVVFRYRLENALLFHRTDEEDFEGDDFDELNLNVTGHGTEVPVRSASATFHLPAGAAGVRARAWAGSYGSRAEDVDVSVEGAIVRASAEDELAPGEGMTVAVAWDAGVVDRPGALSRAGFWLEANWILLLPLLALGVMAWLWWTRGRDPDLRSVAARYEPPEGLGPGEVGVLVDHSPDMRDVTASLVDLAVRGHLVIEEREGEKLLGLISDREYALIRRTGPDDWSDLHPHERELLEGVFDDGAVEEVELSDLEDEFYKHLSAVKDGLFDRLVDLGYYGRRPDRVRRAYVAGAVVLTMLLFVIGHFLADRFLLTGGRVLLSSLGSGLVVAGIGWFMPARTRKGARALEEALGFEEFLERVEEDRFRRMIEGPEDFEKYLPYAMALKVEKKWAAAFEDIYTEPPDWYRGAHPGDFHAAHFAASMSNLSTRAGTAMASSPRGAGGSGFSGGGGGFSGGGVGGGGTGGF